MAEAVGVTWNTVARWERGEIPIRESMARLIRLVTGGTSAKASLRPTSRGSSTPKPSKRSRAGYPARKGRKGSGKGSVSRRGH